MNDYPTNMLDEVLESTSPEQVKEYLDEYEDALVSGDHPFADYFRRLLREKGMTKQSILARAEFTDKVGYRLLSQERTTKQRDYILRLCLAAQFTLKETQRALKLYGMPELYAKVPRDVVLIIALNQGVYDLGEVNEMLLAHGFERLRKPEESKNV
ncbi:MAG: hypothetical protein LUE29_14235 [Lachnospiraceae bacterium]|nr:hypothetical protein [Lachnospiraceae bacterium]